MQRLANFRVTIDQLSMQGSVNSILALHQKSVQKNRIYS